MSECGFDDVSLLAYPLISFHLPLSLSLAAAIDCVFLPRDYLTNLLATTTCISLIYAARDCCEKKILMMMIPEVCLPLSPLKHSCVCRVARFCLNTNNTTRRRQKRDCEDNTVFVLGCVLFQTAFAPDKRSPDALRGFPQTRES